MPLHPFHPASPDYQDMVDAGRTGPYRFGGPDPIPQASGCVSSRIVSTRLDQYGRTIPTYTRCCAPAPYVTMDTVMRVERPTCDEHFHSEIFFEDGRPRPHMTWWVVCSVCNRKADYRSRLDASGRCDRCRP